MKERSNQKGFTLLELLVAVSLLAIGLLATASMEGVAVNSNGIANRVSSGALIGQEVMEDLLALPRNHAMVKTAQVNTQWDLNPADPASTDIRVPSSGLYRATVTVSPNTPVTNVSRIDVTITRVDEIAGAQADISSKGERRVVTLTAFKRVQ